MATRAQKDYSTWGREQANVMGPKLISKIVASLWEAFLVDSLLLKIWCTVPGERQQSSERWSGPQCFNSPDTFRHSLSATLSCSCQSESRIPVRGRSPLGWCGGRERSGPTASWDSSQVKTWLTSRLLMEFVLMFDKPSEHYNFFILAL